MYQVKIINDKEAEVRNGEVLLFKITNMSVYMLESLRKFENIGLTRDQCNNIRTITGMSYKVE